MLGLKEDSGFMRAVPDTPGDPDASTPQQELLEGNLKQRDDTEKLSASGVVEPVRGRCKAFRKLLSCIKESMIHREQDIFIVNPVDDVFTSQQNANNIRSVKVRNVGDDLELGLNVCERSSHDAGKLP